MQLPVPSEMLVPVWELGFKWNYITENGRWENWTVVDLDTKNGYDTYRIEKEYSRARDIPGVTSSTLWLHRDSLGMVAFTEGDFGQEFEPPAAQIFPIINRTYDIEISTTRYPSMNGELNQTVLGWTSIATQAGTFDAVKVDIEWQSDYHEYSYPQWYSPTTKSLVLFEKDPVYELVEWDLGSAETIE